MKYTEIPERADDPVHFLLWGADEILPIMSGLVFGMIVGQVKIFLLLGFVITYFYKKFRDAHADGYFLHMMYWYGFLPAKKFKIFKNPYNRRYLP